MGLTLVLLTFAPAFYTFQLYWKELRRVKSFWGLVAFLASGVGVNLLLLAYLLGHNDTVVTALLVFSVIPPFIDLLIDSIGGRLCTIVASLLFASKAGIPHLYSIVGYVVAVLAIICLGVGQRAARGKGGGGDDNSLSFFL
jgi:hypothetical protein